ncbi:hypothetical protein, partial [Paralimibaculum aggregatum]
FLVHEVMTKGFHGIVNHFNTQGWFDAENAGKVLRNYERACELLGCPVELPPDFAKLLARHLEGELPARKGRRTPYGFGEVQLEFFKGAVPRIYPNAPWGLAGYSFITLEFIAQNFFDNNEKVPAWFIEKLREDFKHRRKKGEKYDALVAEYKEMLSVGESTVKGWLRS